MTKDLESRVAALEAALEDMERRHGRWHGWLDPDSPEAEAAERDKNAFLEAIGAKPL